MGRSPVMPRVDPPRETRRARFGTGSKVKPRIVMARELGRAVGIGGQLSDDFDLDLVGADAELRGDRPARRLGDGGRMRAVELERREVVDGAGGDVDLVARRDAALDRFSASLGSLASSHEPECRAGRVSGTPTAFEVALHRYRAARRLPNEWPADRSTGHST